VQLQSTFVQIIKANGAKREVPGNRRASNLGGENKSAGLSADNSSSPAVKTSISSVTVHPVSEFKSLVKEMCLRSIHSFTLKEKIVKEKSIRKSDGRCCEKDNNCGERKGSNASPWGLLCWQVRDCGIPRQGGRFERYRSKQGGIL